MKLNSNKIFIIKLSIILIFPLTFLLNKLSENFPNLTEKLYSQTLYPHISLIINNISGIFPFSIMEILIILFIIFSIIFIIKLIVKIKNKTINFSHIKKYILNLLCILSCIYFAFTILCGLNYNRMTFSQLAGYKLSPTSTEILYRLCVDLADKSKKLRENINQQGKVFQLSKDYIDTAKKSSIYYNDINKIYPFLKKGYSAPKLIIFSEIMSYLDITGVIFPYTMESNINTSSPDFMIPATMCHELSHVRGFMREDEANFISYLVCVNSNDIEFQYSGYMLALIHSTNALRKFNENDFKKLVDNHYSYDMILDLQNNSEYWQKHNGWISKISNSINNSYLKANGQNDGVQSYGRMVDLLIAEFKKNNNIND